jgi:hypothetical protein
MNPELQYFISITAFAYVTSSIMVFNFFQTGRSFKRRVAFAALWLPLLVMVMCENKRQNR